MKEILNHVIADFELFLEKISTAVNGKQPAVKGKSKTESSKKAKKPPVVLLPSTEEYISSLQKIKYGLNLLVSAATVPSELQGSKEKPCELENVRRPHQKVWPRHQVPL